MNEQAPPAAPEPPAPPPQQQNSGCGTVLAILFGIVLLLPGTCVLLVMGATGPGHIGYEEQALFGICLVLAIFGLVLIYWAVRKS